MLPALLTALAVLALVPVMLPLLRGGRGVAGRAAYDRAVYRDQLQELDRDVARGLISETEAATARLEIQRRLLASDAVVDAAPVRLSRSPVLALLVGLVVAGGATVVYLDLGAPGVPDVPFAERQQAGGVDVAAAGGGHDMKQAAAALSAKLAKDPNDPQSWLLLGRTEATLNAWDKAADAFHHAIELGVTEPAVQAGYGEMLVMQAEGVVTPAAQAAFAAVLKVDPANDVARYYSALASGQAGEPQKAIDQLQTLAADLPADSEMRGEIGKRIQEAAARGGLPVPKLAEGRPAALAPPGPDQAATAAAAQMPEADRRAMIAGMVAKLAAQQAGDPSNFDGWMRLGRAYAVMGEKAKALDALDHAIALKPADPEIKLAEVSTMLGDLKPSDPFPPRALALLREVQLVAPDAPAVLWYLGVEAARGGHPTEARHYWTRLLGKLPAGEDANMVKAALEQVKGG
jgi:cytochrome c-type biogenesis protein CcmH